MQKKGLEVKVLLIDDHVLFRDGLLLILEKLDTIIESFEAGSYESAKAIMNKHKNIDLVLLDLGLPGLNSLDALSAIHQQLPNSLVVILSGTEDCHMVEKALQLGARGYIPKSSPKNIILNALHLVLSGGIYIPPQILQKTITGQNVQATKNRASEHKLTPRQYEVLHKLAKGKSNKAIAKLLNLTESTVHVHVSAILKLFNVNNRTKAVQHAIQQGWIKINDFN